jgi:hypothetical protein
MQVLAEVLGAVLNSWRLLAAGDVMGAFGGAVRPWRAGQGGHVMEQTGVGGQRQD